MCRWSSSPCCPGSGHYGPISLQVFFEHHARELSLFDKIEDIFEHFFSFHVLFFVHRTMKSLKMRTEQGEFSSVTFAAKKACSYQI